VEASRSLGIPAHGKRHSPCTPVSVMGGGGLGGGGLGGGGEGGGCPRRPRGSAMYLSITCLRAHASFWYGFVRLACSAWVWRCFAPLDVEAQLTHTHTHTHTHTQTHTHTHTHIDL
jgi:hypothetical protein